MIFVFILFIGGIKFHFPLILLSRSLPLLDRLEFVNSFSLLFLSVYTFGINHEKGVFIDQEIK